jgi:hypothetical protein
MADKPTKFEDYRYLGDKRTQRVYDLEDPELDQTTVDDIMAAESFVCFGPDTLDEARNRCYRPAG